MPKKSVPWIVYSNAILISKWAGAKGKWSRVITKRIGEDKIKLWGIPNQIKKIIYWANKRVWAKSIKYFQWENLRRDFEKLIKLFASIAFSNKIFINKL